MKIYELHIENLVLHGIDPSERYRVGDALKQEMARELALLFAGPDAVTAMTRNVEIGALDAGAIELQPGVASEGIGIQLAKAIHGSLTTNPKGTTQP